MAQLGEVPRVERPMKDFFEIFDIDETITIMQGLNWVRTF